MESIAYLINRKFVLIAFDTNYIADFGGSTVDLKLIKKAYKLNDHNLISVIGNPYKTSDIFNYVLKLNELGHNGSFEKIIEDLDDVFNSAKTEVVDDLEELTKLLPHFYDDSGNVNITDLFEQIKKKPQLVSLLQETISSSNQKHPAMTQVFVFGWDKELEIVKMNQIISVGQKLTYIPIQEYQKDFVYIRFASSTLNPNDTVNIEHELVQKLTPYLTEGWDSDFEQTDTLINVAKEVLVEGLKKICPYEREPNIVFYELSSRTNYVFEEPEQDLTKLEFLRKQP